MQDNFSEISDDDGHDIDVQSDKENAQYDIKIKPGAGIQPSVPGYSIAKKKTLFFKNGAPGRRAQVYLWCGSPEGD